MDSTTADPPLHVGSIVEIRENAATVASGDCGRRGTVLQVRRHGDGSFEFSVGMMTDGDEGGLYPVEWLEPTGETHPGLTVDTTRRTGVSTRVSEDGDLLGRTTYEVLEEAVGA